MKDVSVSLPLVFLCDEVLESQSDSAWGDVAMATETAVDL